jgi:hypothetical protein
VNPCQKPDEPTRGVQYNSSDGCRCYQFHLQSFRSILVRNN